MIRMMLFAAMVLMPVTAGAQDVVLKGLTPAGKPTVFVTDDRGHETRGRMVTLTDEEVVVLVDGEQRRLDLSRVDRITRRGDSLKNGAIAGALIGATVSLLAMASTDCGEPGCDTGLRLAWIAGSSAAYASIGTALDAIVQGRTLIYQRPSSLGINAGPKGASVAVRLTW